MIINSRKYLWGNLYENNKYLIFQIWKKIISNTQHEINDLL